MDHDQSGNGGGAVGDAVDAIAALVGEAADVDFQLTIADTAASIGVTCVSLQEPLGRLYRASVQGRSRTPLVDRDLLGKDVHLRIERLTEQRSVRGMIASASVRREHHGGGYLVAIEIVPAMHFMSHTVDCRIYQDVTVPDLVQSLVRELVGSRSRNVQTDALTQSYPTHEYLVQYHESHVQLLTRLCEEEGISFYFEHDAQGEDHEVLVLFDANDNRPLVRSAFDGRVRYSDNEEHARHHEVATAVSRHERIGATDAVVTGFDWSNPGASVRKDLTDRGTWSGPKLEVHDHFASVRHHEYDDGGGRYGSHTADRQARMRTESLDLARQSWTIDTTVVTAKPGYVLELEGAGEHDGRYLITAVHGDGHSDRDGIGEYRASLTVVPESVPYRPPPPPRRYVPGPETATVVGEPGEEITTDRHGRVHVQFHWDRRGQRDAHSSAWIRVVQGWAGAGWGTIFIPRIGMEVLVQFLGGDPDRPIITGCIYNGQNPPPYALPDNKTRSTIKTNSSLGGGGYNELRFEDKSGDEEVFIHAQKDFNEVVEHDHSTHVKNDQTNTVDGYQTQRVGKDQKEHVEGEQTMVVDKDRNKTIKQNESTKVLQDRTEVVGGNEEVKIEGTRAHTVTSNDFLTVEHGTREVTVKEGRDVETYKGGRVTHVHESEELNVVDGANRTTHVSGDDATTVDGKQDVTVTGTFALVQGGAVPVSGPNVAVCSPGHILLESQPMALVELLNGAVHARSHNGIYLESGDSSLLITPSGITLASRGPIEIKTYSARVRLTPNSVKIESTVFDVDADAAITMASPSTAIK